MGAIKITSIKETFALCKSENRCAFIPFLTCGFPSLDATAPLMVAAQEGGADIIELGVPFSDPMADGPTIQKSSQIALDQGVTLASCLETVGKARELGLHIPVVLMGYLNPFFQYGLDKLLEESQKVQVNGFIIVDLPPEEIGEFHEKCKKQNIAMIALVAPTTTDHRLDLMAKGASGYIYCVSLTGVTGARSSLPDDLPEFLDRGFGLSTREHVEQVSKVADGAVIGSKIIQTIESGGSSIEERCSSLKEYCREVTGRRTDRKRPVDVEE